jgi:hypothetical protein
MCFQIGEYVLPWIAPNIALTMQHWDEYLHNQAQPPNGEYQSAAGTSLHNLVLVELKSQALVINSLPVEYVHWVEILSSSWWNHSPITYHLFYLFIWTHTPDSLIGGVW